MNRRVTPQKRAEKKAREPFASLFRSDHAPKVEGGAAATPSDKRPDRGMTLGYVIGITLLIGVVTGAFVYHLGVRFEGVRLGYETSKARAMQTRLLLERRELRLELASLKSPGRVETEAREKLGMEVPDHDRIVPIGKKRKVVSVSGGAL